MKPCGFISTNQVFLTFCVCECRYLDKWRKACVGVGDSVITWLGEFDGGGCFYR